MRLPIHWLKRRRSIVHQLSSTTASEAIQATTKAAMAAVGLEPAGTVLAAVLKETVIVIMANTSRVQNADPLVLHELRRGLAFLRETADHAADTPQAVASRNDLFGLAHDRFNDAGVRAANSRDDCVFIAAIDCIALACYDGRHTAAIPAYARMKQDLCVLLEAAEQLRAEASSQAESADALERWTRRINTVGIDGPIMIRRRQRALAKQLQRKADEVGKRVSLVKAMADLAEKVLRRRNVSVDDAATLKALADAWSKES